MTLLTLLFMCSQSEVKERIEHDSVFFYPLYGGKTFLASESEKILLKKIYDSRTPWAPSRGCPPAPCFTYSSEALQKKLYISLRNNSFW